MLPGRLELILGIGLGIVIVTDVIFCIATVRQMHHLVSRAAFFDQLQDFTDNFGNALTRRVQRRMTKPILPFRQERFSQV